MIKKIIFIEPSLKPDSNSATFIIWYDLSPRNMIPLYPIWSAFCPNCFVKFRLSASSVFIYIVKDTVWLFNTSSSCSIASLIFAYFISCISGNLAFYSISLHDFFITQLLSISLPRQIFSSLTSWQPVHISFPVFKISNRIWNNIYFLVPWIHFLQAP